ncbi:MAG: Spy/CpxP family protein refolding chaperone [Deltaproteobacteria bacterium]|nr:Spy/CpxP family protein refolding chaperone [Deltaproteobacteria bacterium]MBK8716582.1 Spy/CpxP family protein refolding chaperone [Deltaproteobacteria bacterium]MBP7289494.1 Spy/CpxP family protein refolding chaperone [Nannocystaceae bacterium]
MSTRTIGLVALTCLALGGAVAWYAARTDGAHAPVSVVVPDDDDADDTDADDDGEKAAMQAKAKICKKLACTDSQRGELGTLIRVFRDDTRERRVELKNLRASAAQAWASATPDAARIAEIETRVLELEGEIEGAARGALLGFHRVLDDEQRRKLSRWLRRKSARDLLQDKRVRSSESE